MEGGVAAGESGTRPHAIPLPAHRPLSPAPAHPQLLRCCGFSAEFRNEMVFPLTALFFGTGNQASGRCIWSVMRCGGGELGSRQIQVGALPDGR